MMLRQQLVELIGENVQSIVPEISERTFSADDDFAAIGLNSIDRGELITLTLERLQLDISRIEFAHARTVNELANLFLKNYE